MENLTVNLTGKVTKAILNGRMHMVAPVRMIVTGVLNGSKGPLYYPPDEIHKDPDSWNHMPLTLGHPMQDGRPVSARKPNVLNKYALGVLLNVKAVKGILDGEAWFDIDRTLKIEPRIIESLKANKPIELSTGLFTDNVPAQNGANYRGRPYTFVARNYKPDHLAILVDSKGACSLKDGCGVLVNADADSNSYSSFQKWAVGTAIAAGATLGAVSGGRLGVIKGAIKALPHGEKVLQRVIKGGVNAGNWLAKRDSKIALISSAEDLAKHQQHLTSKELAGLRRHADAVYLTGPSAYVSKSGKEFIFSPKHVPEDVISHELGHILDQRKVGRIKDYEYAPLGTVLGKQYKREVAAWTESGFKPDPDALKTYAIVKSEARKGAAGGAAGGALAGLGLGSSVTKRMSSKSKDNCGTGAGGFKPGNTCATTNVNIVNNIIRRVGKKWRLYSHKGKNLGTFDSKEAAMKHEQQVKYFKHINNEEDMFLQAPSINCLKGLSYGQLKDELQERLDDLASTMNILTEDEEGVEFSIVDVYDDYVLYTDGKDDYVQEYVNEDGHVMLEGEPEQVDDQEEFPETLEVMQEDDVSPTQNSWDSDLHPRDEFGRFAKTSGEEASKYGKFARHAEEHSTAAELHGKAYTAYLQAGKRSRNRKEQYLSAADKHARMADLHYAASSTIARRKRVARYIQPSARLVGQALGGLIKKQEAGSIAGDAVGYAISTLAERKKVRQYE